MPPTVVFSLFTILVVFLSAIAAAFSTAAEALTAIGNQLASAPPSDPPPIGSVPQSNPVLPTPHAGESSEAFVQRLPPTLSSTIPAGLKYDPWSTPDNAVGVYGAWVPVEAPFASPPV